MEEQLIREFSRISRQKFGHLESQDFAVAGQGRARLDLDQRLLVVLEVESQGPESETRIRATVIRPSPPKVLRRSPFEKSKLMKRSSKSMCCFPDYSNEEAVLLDVAENLDDIRRAVLKTNEERRLQLTVIAGTFPVPKLK